jgi:nitrite reductase (NADH) small subunit
MTAESEAVCKADDVAPGEKRLVRRGRRDILLCRAGNGKFYAVGARCPHQGARLELGRLDGTSLAPEVGRYEYGRDGEILRCPWHAWEFDIATGQSLFGEANARIATYRVTVQDGDVFVEGTTTSRASRRE